MPLDTPAKSVHARTPARTEATGPLSFDLPFPPSVNGIWRGGRGGRHYLSATYKAWKQQAGLLVASQARGKRIAGPYAVQINLVRPDKRRRDLDNLIKTTLDLLHTMGVTDDDSELQELEVKWATRGPPLWIQVRPCGRRGAV